MSEPGYVEMYRSGELERRAVTLECQLRSCRLCPRDCKVDRLRGKLGYCHSGSLPIVSTVCAHHGEEPAISGTEGSGAIFFGNCTMRCVYCQNFQISQNPEAQRGKEMDCKTLAAKMLYLQNDMGCHNINLVTPTHFVPQIVRALIEAVPLGLHIPLVYNTSGYDSVPVLEQLDGIIDVYLPDLRYSSNESAKEFSLTANYVEKARLAIEEMYYQVGDLVMDENEIAVKGLIVRLLVLPNGLAGTEESLRWIEDELSPEVTVSIMSQYLPMHRAEEFAPLSRMITVEEYDTVCAVLDELGMENGWTQDMEAPESYVPDFDRDGHPFVPETQQELP